jgi:SM-20-related protein
VSKPTQVLPPIARIEGFLSEQDLSTLLKWVLSHRERFRPATVSQHGEMAVEPGARRALTTRNFGRELGWLQDRFSAVQDDLLQALRLTVPAIESLELELAAHGKGAHFAPHVDIPIGLGRKPLGGRPGRTDDRLFSAVYYFHGEPKRFEGGNLRLYPLGADPKSEALEALQYVDIEPAQNTLVAFPSWATHEVRNISCPSDTFADHRFAVNCWYCGQFKG